MAIAAVDLWQQEEEACSRKHDNFKRTWRIENGEQHVPILALSSDTGRVEVEFVPLRNSASSSDC